MSRVRAEVFPPSLVPRRSPGATLRDCIQVGGVSGSRIALRGGMTYLSARHFLSDMGVSSKYITPGAIALAALDMVYVE